MLLVSGGEFENNSVCHYSYPQPKKQFKKYKPRQLFEATSARLGAHCTLLTRSELAVADGSGAAESCGAQAQSDSAHGEIAEHFAQLDLTSYS